LQDNQKAAPQLAERLVILDEDYLMEAW
jgi:hypothetical protein